MLDSLYIVSEVLCAFNPSLFSFAVHLTLKPLTSIDGAVCMAVNTIAAHRVIGPTTLINVTVRVVELSITTSLITVPSTCIGRAVRPLHATFSVSQPAEPRPDVRRSRALVSVRWWYIVVDLDIVKTDTCQLLDCLFVFFGSKVLRGLLLIKHFLALYV